MANVRGWDTNGVTKIGALEDGRISLQFSGKDGETRNVFIPAPSLSNLVISLMGFGAKAAERLDIGEAIDGSQMLSVHDVAVAAAKDGSEFSLIVTTQDRLELRFLLTRATIELLADGLVASLSEHGWSPSPPNPPGEVH